jgi:hypothetical protein
MRTTVFITVSATLAMLLEGLIVAQSVTAQKDDSDRAGKPPPVPLIYNPHPPGILPPDLVPEVERGRREISLIFQQALKSQIRGSGADRGDRPTIPTVTT